jgi:hypothetical protein
MITAFNALLVVVMFCGLLPQQSLALVRVPLLKVPDEIFVDNILDRARGGYK